MHVRLAAAAAAWLNNRFYHGAFYRFVQILQVGVLASNVSGSNR